MNGRFYGKTGIFWVQVIVLGWIGLFGVVFGPAFWCGAIKDARGEIRRDAGPPLTIIGTIMLLVAAAALINIIRRRRPIIHCYREGIECEVAAASPFGSFPVPDILRVLLSVVTLHAFRRSQLRIRWEEFQYAQAIGSPVSSTLLLHGVARNIANGKVETVVQVSQSGVVIHPQEIAQIINQFAADAFARARLEIWQDGTEPVESSVNVLRPAFRSATTSQPPPLPLRPFRQPPEVPNDTKHRRRLPMDYDSLFEFFGPKAIGQIAAGTIVVAIMAFAMHDAAPPTAQINPLLLAAIGGAIGFMASTLLVYLDIRRKRTAMGIRKNRGPLFWILVVLAAIAAVIMVLFILILIVARFA